MDEKPKEDAPKRTIIETIEVSGGQLIDKIKDLIKSSNVRTLRVKAGDDFSLEMPVSVGLIAGGVVVLGAPWLAMLGVVAGMMSNVRIEVEREVDTPAAQTDKPDA